MKNEKPDTYSLESLEKYKEAGEEKALYWYEHPLENIRMLRVMVHQDLNKNVDATPHYPEKKEDLKVGVVIGTYGSVPYLDLNLWYLKNVNHISHILIHDDCSDKGEELRNLCRKYTDENCNVAFFQTPQKCFYYNGIGSIGDQSAVTVGLYWAIENKLDVLVKISRRLIPCYNWIDSFKQIVLDSDGITFSAPCNKDLFPLRTQFIGFNVKAWGCPQILNLMYSYVQKELCIYAEYWYSYVAKMLDHQNFSEKYEKWRKEHFVGFNQSGYVHWTDVLGDNRYSIDGRHDGVLWHMYNDKEEYLAKMHEVGLTQYKLEDL